MKTTKQRNSLLALLIGCIYSLGNVSVTIAFSPPSSTYSSPISAAGPMIITGTTDGSRCRSPCHPRQRSFELKERGSDDDDDDEKNDNVEDAGLLRRFLNPRIDDPALPLTEAGLVQVVGPTLQLFWLVSLDSPYPSWAQPLYDYTFAAQGAFLAPTLIHGSALAVCWLLGGLAARAYEQPSFRATNGEYGLVVKSTIQAGAFACGLLILATQFDLYQELGGFVQVGDSAETDLRIYRALVEVINDIFFEFIVLLPWRLFRSNFD